MHRSRLTPIVLGLAWLLSLGAVFLLGILSSLSFHLAPEAANESLLSPTEREAAAVFEQLVGEPLDWAALRSYSPRDREPPQLAAFWEALGRVPSAAEREVLARRFFRELGAVKTGAFVERLSAEAGAAPDRFRGLWLGWHDRDAATAEAYRRFAEEAGRLPPGFLAAPPQDPR
ncbi:MAG: hypothetical protein ACLFR7_00055 [Opitutales bacterium]